MPGLNREHWWRCGAPRRTRLAPMRWIASMSRVPGAGTSLAEELRRRGMRKSDIVKRIASEAFVTRLAAETAVDILVLGNRRCLGARRENDDSRVRHVRCDESSGTKRKKPGHRRMHRDTGFRVGVTPGVQSSKGSGELKARTSFRAPGAKLPMSTVIAGGSGEAHPGLSHG